jgi:hypothetical protein
MRNGGLISMTLLAGLVAGCQTIGDVANSVTGSERASAPQPETNAPQVAVVPSSLSVGVRAGVASGGLSGMTADGLRAAWGEPTLKRAETGGELWQYGGPTCAVLVYLYPASGNAMTVSHAEAVPGGADEAAISACAKAAGKPSVKPIS